MRDQRDVSTLSMSERRGLKMRSAVANPARSRRDIDPAARTTINSALRRSPSRLDSARTVEIRLYDDIPHRNADVAMARMPTADRRHVLIVGS